MLSLFRRNPARKLESEYRKVLEQALQAQRRGDIRQYSELTAQAEAIAKSLDELEAG